MPLTSVEDLFLPLTPDAFSRTVFDREARLLRHPGRSFESLLAPADIDPLLEYGGPRVRVVRDGEPITVTPETVGERSFVDGLYKAYRNGATLAPQQVERAWPPVGRLCAALSAWLGAPVHANLYVTPPNSQGFPAHHDTHDVLVLQLAGRKVWRLYDARIEKPLHDAEGGTPADSTGPVREEHALEPGDVLYVPRGVIHDARCVEQASAHLTIGLYVYRVVDLLTSALHQLAARDPRLRAALPPGLLDQGTDAIETLLEPLRGALADVTAAEAASHLRRRLSAEGRTPSGSRFGALTAPPPIELDTEMRRIAGVTCRVEVLQDVAAIEFMGTAVRGPAFLGPALHFVAERPSFQPRHLPDDLDDSAKLVLVRRLVREGLLHPVLPA